MTTAASGRTYQLDGLHHIQIPMPSGMEAIADKFYNAALGLQKVPKPKHLAGRGGCWFQCGDLQFHLGVEDPFIPARKAHPAFLVRGLDSLRAELEANQVNIIEDPQLEGHRRFYVNDPFGNRLEFIERLSISS
jgi:catechol 2,3-dioxygenase-like lactoylglutathione lyase family enzyme